MPRPRELEPPRILRQTAKAHGLGLLYYFGPRFLALLISRWKRRNRNRKQRPDHTSSKEVEAGEKKKTSAVSEIRPLLLKSLELHRFPAFCAVTIGGWQLLLPLFEAALKHHVFTGKIANLQKKQRRLIASFSAATLASGAGLHLLNSQRPLEQPAGRTIDLTIFAVVRALDVTIGEAWNQRRRLVSMIRDHGNNGGSRNRISRAAIVTPAPWESAIAQFTDPAVFAVSSAVIMFSFFFHPQALPISYRVWLLKFAALDERLIEVLRRIRSGEWKYGVETGQGPLLGSMCEDLGLPVEWGNPVVTEPIPCQLVHSGLTPSCARNTFHRALQAWKAAFTINLGLNSISTLRLLFRNTKPTDRSLRTLLKLLLSSARSATFLGAFVGVFWAAVCLTRTVLAPKLWPNVPKIVWEKSCVQVGCALCGLSILIEKQKRWKEIMFFVAPRAAAAVLPRQFKAKYQHVETLVFATAAGIVLTAAREKPERVRGVFGKLLGAVV